jgi:hypothetical protein
MSTVAIDLDGVLAQYDGKYQEGVIGPPADGAIEFCEWVRAQNMDIAVHTCRPIAEAWAWLQLNGFPYQCMVVSEKKPVALTYIDDRAHRFDGNWGAAKQAIFAHPWWKQHDGKPKRASLVVPITVDASPMEAALDKAQQALKQFESVASQICAAADRVVRTVQVGDRPNPPLGLPMRVMREGGLGFFEATQYRCATMCNTWPCPMGKPLCDFEAAGLAKRPLMAELLAMQKKYACGNCGYWHDLTNTQARHCTECHLPLVIIGAERMEVPQ